jgi:ribonuclease P protein component
MPAPRHAFPRSRKLGGLGTFKAIRDAGVRVSRGPLTLWAQPNSQKHCRLGISTPRSAGIASRRNRIKRYLRESFRLLQHDFPRGYDLVVAVRPHEPLILAEYQKLLQAMIVQAHSKSMNR